MRSLREGHRRDDRNAAEWVQHQQVFVPREDKIGMAVDGQVEKLVISRIAADRNVLGNCQAMPMPSVALPSRAFPV